MPEVASIDSKFSDAGFWKIEGSLDEDIEDMLADYE